VAGETIVFFPKYSTLVGAASPGIDYYSDPFEVTGYKTVTAETGFGGAVGSAAISARMQQSSDLITWTSFGSAMEPASQAVPVQETEQDPARYVRLKVNILGAGQSPSLTFWAKAVARDS
jgi:hypothetical protein